MITSLLGALFGGIFRMAPEILKWLDKASERKHELAMLGKEMEFAKIRGEITSRQLDASIHIAETDAISAAIVEQGQTARTAGKLVAALSALVRPIVTYWFVIMYSLVKILAMSMAISQGGDWKVVIVTSWNVEDMAMLNMVLTFWFVGRVWERKKLF